MSLSLIQILNSKGEVVIARHFRDDIARGTAEAFGLKVVATKETGSQPPVKVIDGASFLYTRHNNLYFVAVTRSNVNPALIFEFLFQWIRILKSYLSDDFGEEQVRNTMTLLYELMDETMDFGYPQTLSVDVLKMYINLGVVKAKEAEDAEAGQLTSQITGIVDWRREGLRYRKNEVYIDVNESVNLLIGTNGNILRNECSGQVVMKTQLSGMPECKFALNDKLNMEKESSGAKASSDDKRRAVEIDDCTFHRCVRLGKFDSDRTITFVPPDGEFELMKYRVTGNISLPFRLVPAVQESGKSKVTLTLKVTANFGTTKFASNVIIKFPVPPNTAKTSVKVGAGRAKFEPDQKAIVWRIKRFNGGCEFMLQGDVDLMQTTRNKAWSRPPISVDFNVSMFTASGVYVRYLRVFDKSGYHTHRWVRYVTRAGEYQIRI
jgi:AP-2 complex subunit mu-1